MKTIIRLVNGELIVISPIQVDNTTIRYNAIGNVSYIIAPPTNYLFADSFKTIYPKASPGLQLGLGESVTEPD